MLGTRAGAAGLERTAAFVVIVVGAIVVATLRRGRTDGSVHRDEIGPVPIGGIGVAAGFAAAISGVGWGPIGATLLIVPWIDPRHAIGSLLDGRAVKAVAAVVTYAVTAATIGGLGPAPTLFLVLLAASLGAVVPRTVLISRLDRSQTSLVVAPVPIGLALPTPLGVAGR